MTMPTCPQCGKSDRVEMERPRCWGVKDGKVGPVGFEAPAPFCSRCAGWLDALGSPQPTPPEASGEGPPESDLSEETLQDLSRE